MILTRLLKIFLFTLLIYPSLFAASDACTGIYYSDRHTVLAGNNEDFRNPDTIMHFVPAEKGKYGCVYFGFRFRYPQGGMNDQGLFFDGFATETCNIKGRKDKPLPDRNLFTIIMEDCATVDEAIDEVRKYNLASMSKFMIMVGDAHGDSAIIEGDRIVRKKGNHQVCTNFRQSKTNPDKYYSTCWRYAEADKILKKLSNASVNDFREILENTHQEGANPTQYSQVYDLKNLKIHIYHFYNFDNVVEIDLLDELQKGERLVNLPDLFPTNKNYENFYSCQKKQLEALIEDRVDRSIDSANWQKYTGDYTPEVELPIDVTLTIEYRKGKLIAYSDEKLKIEILPESKNRFFYLDFDYEISLEFHEDGYGEISYVLVETKGQKFKCTRRD